MLTWIMFLKFLDDVEQIQESRAKLAGTRYRSVIERPYRWRDWAAQEDGITGDELIAFVNQDEAVRPDGKRGKRVFAYLRSLQGTNGGDRRDVIATVFAGVVNRMINGYLLRDVINKINGIHFTSSEEIQTLGHFYESMLKEMRDSAGDSGEFYTPRPVVRFMVEVTNPQLGETVLDPACGTGGFLVEAYQHLEKQCQTVQHRKTLQQRTIHGGEAKSLPYLLCQMNLLLHGLEFPQIDPGNSLRHKLTDLGIRDRVDVILTNPPFGGEEEAGIKANFPNDKQTSETDLSFARLVAGQKSEDLFKRRHYPDQEREPQRTRMGPVIDDFMNYVETLGRSHDYLSKLRGRLHCLRAWMEKRRLLFAQDVSPTILRKFQENLRNDRGVTASTANHYLDAVHNFYGYVIFKRKLMPGPNPAATGRQAELDRLPHRVLPPPTIYPDQVNAVIEVAAKHFDTQTVNLIVFVCEGGFRFQELQFLQVGDINLGEREIILDIKKPNLERVRPELRRRCLTADGLWIPKSRAARRPIHISDRLARVIGSMGLGEPSDWVFLNRAGRQVAENKTLSRLKGYALKAGVLVEENPRTGKPWSLLRWHWLRHYHRTRAHVSEIRREVSKLAMGHTADPIHDHYRGLDRFAFHAEYAKFESGIDDTLLTQKGPLK